LRLLFSQRFELAVNLCHVAKFAEVENLLPEVKGMAFQLGNELDKLRLAWLSGRVHAGCGRLDQAIEILSSVRHHFTERQLAYDAALVAMDLAGALLAMQLPAQVKALALQMAPIFGAHEIHANARKALLLFREAAFSEAVTVELVRTIARYLRRARSKPELEFVVR
jgi:hypothetical protein